MLAKRIIPCLDIKDGRTVKGVNFVELKDAGDPVELGALYAEQGADELVYLDITATHEKRKMLFDLVKRIARNINIPFTVGGGVNEIADAEHLLNAGAEKVSVNSAAVKDPALIDRLSGNFGNQFVVVAIDARQEGDQWMVYIHGGRISTGRDLFSWAKEAQERGAGEILFTSMNHDGVKKGFALEATAHMSSLLTIPVIASGGAGTMDHFRDVFTTGKADAGLAASIFHYKEIAIHDLKKYLKSENIEIRT